MPGSYVKNPSVGSGLIGTEGAAPASILQGNAALGGSTSRTEVEIDHVGE
jgi:hypothetical protein